MSFYDRQIGELLLQEVAPRIRSAVPYCVRTVGCEDHEEIIQDTICMAAKLYDSAERAGSRCKLLSVNVLSPACCAPFGGGAAEAQRRRA